MIVTRHHRRVIALVDRLRSLAVTGNSLLGGFVVLRPFRPHVLVELYLELRHWLSGPLTRRCLIGAAFGQSVTMFVAIDAIIGWSPFSFDLTVYLL